MRNESASPAVYVVHPDRDGRSRLCALIARLEFSVREFSSADAFLNAYQNGGRGCLVIDMQGPGAYELLARLREAGGGIPAIMIADRGDVPAAVGAMRAGAASFIRKPYAHGALMREIRRVFE